MAFAAKNMKFKCSKSSFSVRFRLMSHNRYLYLAWALSLVATMGSLFLSYFMKLPPCDLCWYQRIFMFPLVMILWVGFSKEDQNIHLYSLPLIIVGLLIAIYHNLLYYKLITPSITPCTSGVSCTERQLDLFGFLSIPLMSLIGFLVLLTLILLHKSNSKKTIGI